MIFATLKSFFLAPQGGQDAVFRPARRRRLSHLQAGTAKSDILRGNDVRKYFFPHSSIPPFPHSPLNDRFSKISCNLQIIEFSGYFQSPFQSNERGALYGQSGSGGHHDDAPPVRVGARRRGIPQGSHGEYRGAQSHSRSTDGEGARGIM